MSIYYKFYIALSIAIGLLLTSCNTDAFNQPTDELNSNTPLPSLQVSPSASTTHTLEEPAQSPTPLIELSTTPLVTFHNPDFLTLPFADHPLISSFNSDCILPCWYGLEPGRTTLDEAIAVLRQDFEFDENIDFAALLKPGMDESDTIFQGIRYLEFVWVLTPLEGNDPFFSFEMVFNDQNQLIGMQLTQLPQDHYLADNAKSLIETLGTPNAIRVSVTKEGPKRLGVFRLNLIYSNGIRFQAIYEQEPITLDPLTYSSLCFTEVPKISYAYLVTPFDETQQQGTVTQEEWILNNAVLEEAMPIDEELGITIDEFVEFMSQLSPCLDIEYESDDNN